MCGRFQLTPPEDWLEEFGLTEGPDVTPRYNIAPTQPVVAVRRAVSGRREARMLRWGLVPHWADDPSVGSRMINARAEGLATRPAFRDPFKSRRCLIPATGFYEWRRSGAARDPYLIRPKGQMVFAFAGLWDLWEGGPEPLESCTIVTTNANALVEKIHDRMPVLLDRSLYEAWLDPEARREDLEALLRPYRADAMEMIPVSSRVNAAGVDDPECARPVEEKPPVRQLTLW